MLRGLGILLLAVGVAVFSLSAFHRPPLKCYYSKLADVDSPPLRYCEWDPATLNDHAEALAAEIDIYRQQVSEMEASFSRRTLALTQEARLRRDNAMIEEPPELRRARLELARRLEEAAYVDLNLKIIAAPVAMSGLVGAATGLILLALSFVSFRGEKIPKAFRVAVVRREVELWKSQAAVESELAIMFGSEKAAVRELFHSRPSACAYCGAKLPLHPAGTLEVVQFFKEIPSDIKVAKNIPLGRGMRIIPPETVPCGACGHANRA